VDNGEFALKMKMSMTGSFPSDREAFISISRNG
jgi:hypothetical protein